MQISLKQNFPRYKTVCGAGWEIHGYTVTKMLSFYPAIRENVKKGKEVTLVTKVVAYSSIWNLLYFVLSLIIILFHLFSCFLFVCLFSS